MSSYVPPAVFYRILNFSFCSFFFLKEEDYVLHDLFLQVSVKRACLNEMS